MLSKKQPLENYPARYSHRLPNGRLQCDLCPRHCQLKDGQRGFCFVRQNVENQMVLTTYGRSSGFCIDPIEKKPLNHFYPGSSVLSFGTAGCNLGCQYCQNWDISKSREMDRLADYAAPVQIAEAAVAHGCRSVAFTYNDPVIFAEYAIDVARACHERELKTVAVTAGYINPEARRDFFQHIDAANVDLKAFTDNFYRRHCYGHRQPVLDTLKYLKHETNVWIELTTLIIPGENDSPAEIEEMTRWVVDELGPNVPHHYTAFHPSFKMLNHPATPPATLKLARDIALKSGIQYVYTGNIFDVDGGSTYCPNCHKRLIQRDWYSLGEYLLNEGKCRFCGEPIAGHFTDKAEDWGRRRRAVQIGL